MDMAWIGQWKEVGAFGVILVIFALTMRSMILSTNRSIEKREQNLIDLMKSTFKAIEEHTNVMKVLGEKFRVDNERIILEVKKSEVNIIKHISTNAEDSKHSAALYSNTPEHNG
jgi:hypothetical protein